MTTKDLSLYESLSEVMAKVGYVQKKGKNDFHRYTYARTEDVLTIVNKELSQRGVCIASNASLERYEENHAVVKLTLTFLKGENGVMVQGIGEGSDKGDKSIAKANSQALKYALAGAFLIAWGDDDPEADAQTDAAADAYAKYLGLIQSKSSKEGLEALIPELEALTTKKAISAGQASKLRKAYTAQMLKVS